MGSGRLSALGDPCIDPRAENIERDCAGAKHGVMESANIKRRSKFTFCLGAHGTDA